MTFVSNWTLLPTLMVSIDHLEQVQLANGGCLFLQTLGPIPFGFGTCIVLMSRLFSPEYVVFLDFEFWTSLIASMLLWCNTAKFCLIIFFQMSCVFAYLYCNIKGYWYLIHVTQDGCADTVTAIWCEITVVYYCPELVSNSSLTDMYTLNYIIKSYPWCNGYRFSFVRGRLWVAIP